MARVSALLFLMILANPLVSRAEQGSVGFMPRLEAGKPLTVELRNFSKLPVKVNAARLTFAPSAPGATSCEFALPASVSLAAAEMTTVTLAPSEEVMRCTASAGAPAATSSVSIVTLRELTARQINQNGAAGTTLHLADLIYKLEIGGLAVEGTTTWHFMVE
jgi:hypothetical protein